MVEEYGVHRLADRVVASEGEGQVGYASAGQCSREIGLYPAHRFDEVDSVAAVARLARTHAEHVHVENYVACVESYAPEQVPGPFAYRYLASVVSRLALLVEGHHNHGSPEAQYLPRLFEESVLALLETDGVDHALALGVLQSGKHRVPVRGVDHQRGLRYSRFGGYAAHESLHLDGAVQHCVVHIYVYERGPVFYLFRGYLYAFGVIAFGDESCELARTGYIGALAYVGEIEALPVYAYILQSAQFQPFPACRHLSRRQSFHGFRNGAYMPVSRTAAAAYYVQQPVFRHFAYMDGHLFGALVVAAQFVGQSCIGIAYQRAFHKGGEFCHQGLHLLGSQ